MFFEFHPLRVGRGSWIDDTISGLQTGWLQETFALGTFVPVSGKPLWKCITLCNILHSSKTQELHENIEKIFSESALYM